MEMPIRPGSYILLLHCRIGVKKLHKMPECCQSSVNYEKATQSRGELQVGIYICMTHLYTQKSLGNTK